MWTPGTRTAVERRRILLVEDEEDLRRTLADALEQHGHTVIAAADGREALRELRASAPDLIVLDLVMPVMDGWAFRVEQRKDPAIASTPVLAMSASRSASAAAVDADVYLQKPVDIDELLAAVDEVMVASERRQAAASNAQRERMAAIGTLAAGVAHEINNPLTYVLLHLTHVLRLLPGLESPDRDRIEEILTRVRGALEGVERMRAITGGILTFSEADSVGSSPIDVRVPLDAALRLIESEIRHRALLIRDYAIDVPPVVAGESRLGQVFLNLLTNAYQAIPEGDVEHQHVRVSVRRGGRHEVVVSVSDTGRGIPERLLARVFEPFFSTKPVGQGTGLGLSISHGIVKALGGDITVESAPGRGTTFRVTLPAATRPRSSRT